MLVWRRNCWCLEIILLFAVISFNVSAVRINEAELNPETNDAGKEWIELYSESEINLENYSIRNNDNQTINLVGSFSGFFVINLTSQWLDNENEKIYLIFNLSLVDETAILEDSANDNKTWQYCNGSWSFIDSTKGSANLCQQQIQNQTNQTSSKNQTQKSQQISIQLEHDEKVENNKDMNVEVMAFNLNGSYDVKVYIEDAGRIISETYDEKEEKWKSSSYYVNEIFFGSGNKSENFKLRVSEEYKNFSGDAKIKAKIRKSGASDAIAEVENNLKILLKKEDLVNNTTTNQETGGNQANNNGEEAGQEGIIKLNRKDINSKAVYKSKTQYIKEYAIYFFALFCVFIIVYLILKIRIEKWKD